MINKVYSTWFFKLLLFVLCVFFIDYIVGRSYNKLHEAAIHNSPESFFYENLLDSVRSDVLIVGSSTASHHYNPSMMEDSLRLSVFNAGQDGVFFTIQNCIINMVLDNYTPKAIIWEIGETCLTTRYDSFEYGHNEYQSLKTIYPFYKTNRFAFNTINGKDSYQKYRMLSHSYVNNSQLLVNLRAVITSEIIENNGYIPLDTLGYNYPLLSHVAFDNSLNQSKIKAFVETINRCDRLGVQLIISSSPRFYDNNVLSSPGYVTLKEIASNNSIPFLEFYSVFQNHPEYFKDVDHMNNKGVIEYMKLFIPKLKNIIN